MFSRIVECYVRTDRKEEFREKIQNFVVPMLESQPGFVDLLALTSEEEPERMVGISLWKSRADEERYHDAHYDEILEAIRPLLQDEPSIEHYNVDASTAHRIAASKAA
jgi:quinol monooxygenase YgiN